MDVELQPSVLCEDDYVSSDSEDDQDQPSDPNTIKDPQLFSQKKSTLERELEFQIKKRSLIIEELRKAYLRDVVAVKHIINEVLEDSERRSVFNEWKETIPSADIKEPLLLRSPYHGALTVTPCRKCGGTVNILFSDVQKVKDLETKVESLNGRNDLLRLMIAQNESQVEKLSLSNSEAVKSHNDEKKYLYAELKKLKVEMEETALRARNIAEINKRMKEENLKQVSNHEDMTIRALSNEKALERALELNNEMKQTIGELRLQVKDYQSGSTDLEAKISVLQNGLKEKDVVLLGKDNAINDLHNDISEMKIQIEKQREFLKNAENALDIASRAKDSSVEENRKLQFLLEKQIQANEVLEDRVESLREEVKELGGEVEAVKASLFKVQDQRDAVKAMVTGLELTITQKNDEVSSWSRLHKELQGQSDQEVAAFERELESRDVEIAKKERECEELESALLAANKTVSVRDAELARRALTVSASDTEVVPVPQRRLSNNSENAPKSKDQPYVVAHSKALNDEASAEVEQANRVRYGNNYLNLSKFTPGDGETRVGRTELQPNDSSTSDPAATDVITASAGDNTPSVASAQAAQEQSPADTDETPKKKYTPVSRKAPTARIENKTAVKKQFEHLIMSSALDEGSAEENDLRNAVLSTISEALDENTAKKVVNALTALLASKAKLFETARRILSRFVNAQIATMQTTHEVKQYLSACISCIVNAQGEFPSVQTVDDLLANILQMYEVDPTTNAVKLAVDIASDDTKALMSYHELLVASTPITIDTLTGLGSLLDATSLSTMADQDFTRGCILPAAKDWADAKKVLLGLDDTIAQAKQSIRAELEPTIEEQALTIQRLTAKLDTESAGRKLLIQKLGESTAEVAKLKPRSEKLAENEQIMKILQKEHGTLQIKFADISSKYNALLEMHKSLETNLADVHGELKTKNLHLDDHKSTLRNLRKSISDQSAETMALNQRIQEMIERDFRRLNCLVTAATQCDPDVAHIGIQTDFIVHAVSLASNDKSRSKYNSTAGYGQVNHKVVNPFTLLGADADFYQESDKSAELEKAMDALRLGPTQQLAQAGSRALSPFSESLLGSKPSPKRRLSSSARTLPKLNANNISTKRPNS